MLVVIMSKYISELLDAPEPAFGQAIKQLERASGDASVDVRLTAEIVGKSHVKMRELGLDPQDTTNKELYAALQNLVAKHDGFLCRRFGGDDPSDVADILPRVKMIVDRLGIPKQAWAVRPSMVKRLLKSQPPKNLMKQLGYRSLESMLKREPVSHVLAAVRFTESDKWQHDFIQQYRKLRPGDFETRHIDMELLTSQKWQKLAHQYAHQQRRNIIPLIELGTVVIMPLPMTKMPGITLITTVMLLHYINEIRLYSAYFKMQQVKPDFGQILVRTLTDDPADHVNMGGQRIHWRIVQRHFGHAHQRRFYPEIFEPHVQPEDLEWRKAEEVLYRLEPALHFWHDLDYVAKPTKGKPVSFNLLDMAVCYVNGLDYEQRLADYFRDSLWNEICLRYIAEKPLEVQVLKQLDNELLQPDLLDLIGLEV